MLGHRIAVVMLLVAPAVCVAQRGGIGRMNGGRPLLQPTVLTADSIEKLNPISALIAQRKDLGMTDQQVTQLGGVLSRLDATNAPQLRQLDSVGKAMGLSAATPLGDSEADKERMQAYRNAILPIVNDVRDHNDAAAMEALQVFSGEHLRRANAIVRDQRDKIAQLLRGGSIGPPGRNGTGGRSST
jgi:hypothetical protein